MTKDKIALLDTDFISKSCKSCSESVHLLDLLLKLPDYTFYCHEQIIAELSKNSSFPMVWLQNHLDKKDIISYSDEKLLDELQKIYGSSCHLIYADYLKKACEAYDKDFFITHYSDLSLQNLITYNRKEFLHAISKGDASIGNDNDLGEIKSALLLQTLSTIMGKRIYVFCSDDRNARKGMLNFEDVICLSILSVFWSLKEAQVLTKEAAWPYFDSYTSSLASSQTTFRVIEAGTVGRFIKVPLVQLFDDLFENKFLLLRNGMLKYSE